jgi:hypothetical protein
MSNLWWSYDSENGFSALPPGPLLLPAVFIFAFISIANKLKENASNQENQLSQTFIRSDYYQSKKQRYKDLLEKRVNSGLSISEYEEFRRLEHPPWADGKQWQY